MVVMRKKAIEVVNPEFMSGTPCFAGARHGAQPSRLPTCQFPSGTSYPIQLSIQPVAEPAS